MPRGYKESDEGFKLAIELVEVDFLPLPLGEGRGEGLARRKFYFFIARLRRAEGLKKGGVAVDPHPNPLPEGEGTNFIANLIGKGHKHSLARVPFLSALLRKISRPITQFQFVFRQIRVGDFDLHR